MRKIRAVLERILTSAIWRKNGRRVLTGAGGLVVFITIYCLILPAVAIDKESAEEAPGIYLEESGADVELVGETDADLETGVADGSVMMLSAGAGGEADTSDGDTDEPETDESTGIQTAGAEESVHSDVSETDPGYATADEDWNESVTDPEPDGGAVEEAEEYNETTGNDDSSENGDFRDDTDTENADVDDSAELSEEADWYYEEDGEGIADPSVEDTENDSDIGDLAEDAENGSDTGDLTEDAENPAEADSGISENVTVDEEAAAAADEGAEEGTVEEGVEEAAEETTLADETASEEMPEAASEVAGSAEFSAALADATFTLTFDETAAIPADAVLTVYEYNPAAEEEKDFFNMHADLANQAALNEDADWSPFAARIFRIGLEDMEGNALSTEAYPLTAEILFPEEAPVSCGSMKAVKFEADENGAEQATVLPAVFEYDENGGITKCTFETEGLSLLCLTCNKSDSYYNSDEDTESNTEENTETAEESPAEDESAEGIEATAENEDDSELTSEVDGSDDASVSAAEESDSDHDDGEADADADAAEEKTEADDISSKDAETAGTGNQKALFPAQSFSDHTDTVKVQVFAGEGAFPAGTTMTVKDVEDQETINTITDFVEKEVSRVHAVDITFYDAGGNEIEPLKEIRVIMSAEESEDSEAIQVVHVDNDGNAESVEEVNVFEGSGEARAQIVEQGQEPGDAESVPVEAEEDEIDAADENEDGAEKENESENGLPNESEENTGIESTIDEDWENTDTEDLSEFISEEPEESVEFEAAEFSVYAFVYTVDFHWDVDGKEFVYSIDGGSAIALSELVQILDIVKEEDAPQFIEEVEDVDFSSPELLWVGMADEDTTIEEFKKANALDVEYSGNLTGEQIAAINAMVIKAQDWALISLRAFDTQETLTVTMKNGEQFVIRTTDARKPKLSSTAIKFKIVKEWYDAEGKLLDPETLDDTYTADFNLQAYEYDPSDLVRLHFVDSQGNEDPTKTVIMPTGKLRLTLYNTPQNAGKGYLFSEAPTTAIPIVNPFNNINLLTDVAIQSKSVKLDDGHTINYWVMDIDLNDYAGELYDVYLGIMPDGETSGISYFTTGTYPDRTVDVGTGTHAMNIAFLDSGRWHGDTYRNRHIWNTIKGSNNVFTHVNSDLELTSPGGSSLSPGSFFGYTVVEKDASVNGAKNFTTTISWNNGANVIYSNGLTGWSPELFLTSPNENTTIVVKNQLRANVDVPVEKHWDYMKQHDNEYDWEVKFVLQWAPLYEGEGTPSTEFVEVEPRQYITITEAMMDAGNSSLQTRSFKNLPLYGEDENGKFRYEYSVEEESYTIKSHESGEVLATYDRYGEEGQKYTGTLPHFVPYYPHDAGELNANPSDYKVSVVNGEAYSETNPTINITVNKAWDDDHLLVDPNAKAAVKVQRYVQTGIRRFNDDYNSVSPEMIRIYVKEGDKSIRTLVVPKGVEQRIHIHWTAKSGGMASFICSSDPNLVSITETNHPVSSYWENGVQKYPIMDTYSAGFYPVDNMTINITTNECQGGPAVNLEESFSLEEEALSDPVADTAFNNQAQSFILDMNNNWSEMVQGLPLKESAISGGVQTTRYYSYYFTEDLSNTYPSGYKPAYIRYDTVGTDREVELGDDKYRISYDGEHVTILNSKDTLCIRKEWRGIAKSDWVLYPESVFTLYGTNDINADLTDNNINNGTVSVIASGLKLNKANNWKWKPEDTNTDIGSFAYYFVKENTDQMPEWSSNGERYQVWMYYNENGQGSQYQPDKCKTTPKGTITILNALKQDNDYIQIDLKKKWMEWGTPTSWDTTTGTYKRLHDLVMGFVVYRRVWDINNLNAFQYSSGKDHIISPGPMGWSDYGNEILVGYDSNGNRVLDPGGNTFELINGDGGNWHWTINQSNDHQSTDADRIGLPTQGWYTKPNGETVWAYFEYTVRETGIWKNLKKDPVDDPEISWFSNSVPMASWSGGGQRRVNEFNRDIGQDQDRLMNGQAFDMWVEKDWVDSAWDAREVYVKIYRKLQQGDNVEDFTEELARDISIGSLTGYLSDGYDSMIDTENKWVVFTPGRSRLYIDKVLKTHPTADGKNPYDYWLVEVGYKDKHGQVHLYTGNGTDQSSLNNVNDLKKLNPNYYAWDSVNNTWTNQPNLTGQNNQNVGIVLGEKGTNQLKITNTPVRDFAVIKKWKDAIGKEIEAPINELKFKVRQIRTARVNDEAVTKEGYISFGGSTELTITKDNSDNMAVLVAQSHPGIVDDVQQYSKQITTDTDIGGWALYLSGLEEKYYDGEGNLWICTYQIEEVPDSRLSDYVTEVSYDGLIDRDNRNITISNIKMDGGMIKVVKQIADGSDYETEEPFKITVTLTPPAEKTVLDTTVHQIKDYIEVDEDDTILIGEPVTATGDNGVVTITMTLAGRGSFTIKDITPGTTYEVTESTELAPSWRQRGEVAYSNSNKIIVKQQLDTVTITNEEPKVDVPVKKIWVGEDGQPMSWPQDVTVYVALFKQVGSGQKTKAAEYTLDFEHQNYTFKDMPALDGGEITYTVDEVKVTKGEGADPDFDPAEFTSAITGSMTEGYIITNSKGSKGSVKVTKTFAGIEAAQIPSAFKIAATWGGGSDTVNLSLITTGSTGYTGTLPEGVNVTRTGSGLSYAWEISGLDKNTVVTFTESGETLTGYSWTGTAKSYNEDAERTDEKTAAAKADTTPGVAEFTNSYTRERGSLNIKKTGKVNGDTPTANNKNAIDGNYSFTITGTGAAGESVSKTITITLSGGEATSVSQTDLGDGISASVENGVVTISGLLTGSYTVTESLTNGQTTAGIRLLSSSNTTKVTVSANNNTNIPTAEFVNNNPFVEVDIPGTKTFESGTIAQDQFSFTLTATDPSTAPMPGNATVFASTNGSFSFGKIKYVPEDLGSETSKTFTYTVKENLPTGMTATAEERAAEYKIVNGIKYDLSEKTVMVTVSYNSTTGSMTATVQPNEDVSFTNTKLGKLTVTKKVTLNGNADTASKDKKFWVAVYSDAQANNKVAEPQKITITATGSGTVEFADLPAGTYYVYELTAENGTPITGNTARIDGVDYAVTTDNTGAKIEVNTTTHELKKGTASIINARYTVDLSILKVDSEDDKHVLTGAQFKLLRRDLGSTTGTNYTLFENSAFIRNEQQQNTGLANVDANGEIALSGLLPGEYEVTEMIPPPGYIIIHKTFHFTIAADGTVTYDVPSGGQVTYKDKQFLVGNQKGSALPNTGGPGTKLFTILGAMLMLAAGILLISKRQFIR